MSAKYGDTNSLTFFRKARRTIASLFFLKTFYKFNDTIEIKQYPLYRTPLVSLRHPAVVVAPEASLPAVFLVVYTPWHSQNH